MLNELLKRGDVSNFIHEIKTNERYFEKELGSFEDRFPFIGSELALYIFYDALYKYKVVLEDVYLFDEYLEQLDVIYKKLNSYDDMLVGINKLICKMLVIKFDIKDDTSDEGKRAVITDIYNKYILNGYYMHGFNASYIDSLEANGFKPEEYENYYNDYSEIIKIFKKYDVQDIIDKDFSLKEVTFTDDFVMGCYYSMYAPNFFSRFLSYFDKKSNQNGYLIDDYDIATSNLKRFMSNNLFSESDRNIILDLVKRQWDLLHKTDKKISLLFVNRNYIDKNDTVLNEFLSSDEEVYDIADRLLSSKKSKVDCNKFIPSEEFEIIKLDTYYEKEEEKESLEESYEEELYKYKEEVIGNDFLNVYGKVSILLVVGALLITLGVIITLIMILRGI